MVDLINKDTVRFGHLNQGLSWFFMGGETETSFSSGAFRNPDWGCRLSVVDDSASADTEGAGVLDRLRL